MMEQLLGILKSIRADVDFENCDSLVEDEILESFDIIRIIAAISKAFDIEIPAGQVRPKNFNSIEAMWEMIEKLQDE